MEQAGYVQAVTGKLRFRTATVVVTLLALAGGFLVLGFPADRDKELPRLAVLGDRHHNFENHVAFRVVVPGSRKFLACTISNPQVVDRSGHIRSVGLIRFATPGDEPSLGFVPDGAGEYFLQVDVSFEQKGLAGLRHRLRNCWVRKSLQPLRETTFGAPVSIQSEWLTNSVVQATAGSAMN